MGGIDTSMYNTGRERVRLLDPMEQAARAQGMQRNALALDQMQAEREQAMQQQARQGVLRNALASGLRGAALENRLMQEGFLDEAGKVGTMRRTNDKTDLEMKNLRLEREIKVQTRAAQMLQGVKDQAGWQRALSFMEQMADDEEDVRLLSQIPREFDERVRSILVDSTMTAAQKAEAARADLAARRSAANDLVKVDPATGQESLNPLVVSGRAAVAAAGAANQTTPLQWVEVENPDGSKSRIPLPGNVRPGQALPPPVAGGKPGSSTASEDERKAAGWYEQATFAFGNMMEAVKNDREAAFPTPVERAARLIPGQVGDDLSNAVQSPQRQRYTQGVSSFSEAVLRAATGAGVQEAEARQKINELTPRLGDREEVVKQKQEALQMYLQSLKLRAGRALPADRRNAPPGSAPAAPAAAPAAPATTPPKFRTISVTPKPE
jgi:hypothetical protein